MRRMRVLLDVRERLPRDVVERDRLLLGQRRHALGTDEVGLQRSVLAQSGEEAVQQPDEVAAETLEREAHHIAADVVDDDTQLLDSAVDGRGDLGSDGLSLRARLDETEADG